MFLAAIKFAAVGVLNTCVGLGTIYLLKWIFGMHDVPANILGYCVGLCVSYILNARWTFSFRGPLMSAAPRFIAVIVVAYLINLATVSVAIYVLGIDSYIAHAIGVVPYSLTTFLGSRFFVFRKAGADLQQPS